MRMTLRNPFLGHMSVVRQCARAASAVLGVGALLLVTGGVQTVFAPPSAAVERSCALDSVSFERLSHDTIINGEVIGFYEKFLISVKWSEKASCQIEAGDTISIDLPQQLSGISATGGVVDNTGAVVGTTNMSSGKLIVTFGAYAQDYVTTAGDAWGRVEFDRKYISSGESTTLEAQADGGIVTDLTVVPGAPTGPDWWQFSQKDCWWIGSPITATGGVFRCGIFLPEAALAAGAVVPWTNVSLTDSLLGSGVSIVPDSYRIATALPGERTPPSAPRWSRWYDDPEVTSPAGMGFTVTTDANGKGFTAHFASTGTGNQYVALTYDVTFGAPVQTNYTNKAVISADQLKPVTREVTMTTTDAGGMSSGSVVNIEKGDGSAVPTRIDHDADTPATAALYRDGETRTLVMRLSNNGTAPLYDVTVTDRLTVGTHPVTAMECTFPGNNVPTPGTFNNGVWTVTWAQSFSPGTASWAVGDPGAFTCTAQLQYNSGEGPHADRAEVSAHLAPGGALVADSDEYHTMGAAVQLIKYDGRNDFVALGAVPAKPLRELDSARDANTDIDAVRYPYAEGASDTGAQTVRWSVSNIGMASLTNIVISDSTLNGPALTDVSCVFPDGQTGMSWGGVWSPGVTFQCTGLLTLAITGDNVSHADEAHVSANIIVAGTEGAARPEIVLGSDGLPAQLVDMDPFHAITELPNGKKPDDPKAPNADTPAPTATAPSGPSSTPPPPAKGVTAGKGLAQTGAETSIVTVAALGLLCGGVALLWRRRATR